MKLKTKLTLFNTISKLVIVTLFVLLLPKVIGNINQNFTDSKLRKQRDKLLRIIRTSGIKDKVYAAYSPLKEDYYNLEEDTLSDRLDTIRTEKRRIEGDTIEYRILSYNFSVSNRNYLLEMGISQDTVNERTAPLQSVAFIILVGMIFLTIVADQLYSDYVLRPLGLIIKTKLIGQKFPNFGTYKKVETSTEDFQYLDISIHKMIRTIESTFQKEREFISNASHELMTPISILQSKIENMFESEDISDEIKIRLLELQKILYRLKSITKTLLLISQIENDQFLREDSVKLGDLLQEINDEISIRLQGKNITLNISIKEDRLLVKINKFLLYNLFFNLINNAIKYNREGGEITIHALHQNGHYTVGITDTGIGIGPEDLPYIFNRFKKLRQSLQQESFGLGLPIVRSIADFHGIKIDVRSEKGVGSTFKLVFPAEILG